MSGRRVHSAVPGARPQSSRSATSTLWDKQGLNKEICDHKGMLGNQNRLKLNNPNEGFLSHRNRTDSNAGKCVKKAICVVPYHVQKWSSIVQQRS